MDHPVWAEHPLGDGERAAWRPGPLHLEALRGGSVALLTWEQGDDPMVDAVEITEDRVDGGSQARLVSATPASSISLRPKLPDRDVVYRTEVPLTLPPGARVRAYVTCPVWVEVTFGDASLELPSWRPTDTWFGTPRDGQLCYGSRTAMRTAFEGVQVRAHRAITPLDLNNQSDEELVVHRLRLPIPTASMWLAADGSLWTDRFQVDHTDGGEAEVKAVTGAPSECTDARKIADPRRVPSKDDALKKAFNAFFI